MKKIKTTDFQEYENAKYGRDDEDNFDNTNHSIGGTTRKTFIRLDKKVLRPLFRAKTGKNSYVTYADDLFEDCMDEKGDIPLRYISCLLKKERMLFGTSDNYKKEVWGSRLANLFNVPTVYNEIVDYNYETCLVSVDFVKPGQELGVFAETFQLGTIDDMSSFQAWEEYIKIKIGSIFGWSKWNERGSDEHQNDTKDKFVRDFVPYYMFRNMILDDSDFKPRNVNYITEMKDGIKNVTLAPANDFEFAMTYRTTALMQKNMHENMEYLCANYPKETDAFINNMKTRLYKNGKLNTAKIHKIFTDIERDEEFIHMLEDRLLENIVTMMAEYDRIKVENTNQVDMVD